MVDARSVMSCCMRSKIVPTVCKTAKYSVAALQQTAWALHWYTQRARLAKDNTRAVVRHAHIQLFMRETCKCTAVRHQLRCFMLLCAASVAQGT
jgi:hypothetical protein